MMGFVEDEGVADGTVVKTAAAPAAPPTETDVPCYEGHTEDAPPPAAAAAKAAKPSGFMGFVDALGLRKLFLACGPMMSMPADDDEAPKEEAEMKEVCASLCQVASRWKPMANKLAAINAHSHHPQVKAEAPAAAAAAEEEVPQATIVVDDGAAGEASEEAAAPSAEAAEPAEEHFKVPPSSGAPKQPTPAATYDLD